MICRLAVLSSLSILAIRGRRNWRLSIIPNLGPTLYGFYGGWWRVDFPVCPPFQSSAVYPVLLVIRYIETRTTVYRCASRTKYLWIWRISSRQETKPAIFVANQIFKGNDCCRNCFFIVSLIVSFVVSVKSAK